MIFTARQTITVKCVQERIWIKFLYGIYTWSDPFSSQHHHRSAHCRNTCCITDCLASNLMVAFLMIAYVIDIVSLLFSIFYTGKNTADICFSFCAWTKTCRIRKKFFQELDRNDFLSIVLDRCCRKHSHILKTTHMIRIALSKSHKETNTFHTWNCFLQETLFPHGEADTCPCLRPDQSCILS